MLLANAGLECEAIPASIDERAIQQRSGLQGPAEIAALLALEKARAVAATNPGRVVLGADQTLALGDRLFNKPAGRTEAAAQLRALSGKTHELHSAVALVGDGGTLYQGISVARMTMRELSDHALENYLDAAGAAVTTSVGGLSARRARRAFVRADRRRSLHHSWASAAAIAAGAAR